MVGRRQVKAQLPRITFSSSTAGPEHCIFCQIISRKAPSRIVYEDDRYIAFLDAFPFSRGHTLVCPKKHGETIWDMEEGDIAELFRISSKVSRAVVEATGADGFRFVQNNGEAANQVVAHVHVHVIPVKMEDRGKYADRKRLTAEEMQEAASAIKAKIVRPGQA